MELTLDWLKAEQEKTLQQSIALNTKTLWSLMQATYNLGLEVGRLDGRQQTLAEVIETLEQGHEQDVSHAVDIRSNGQPGSAE